MGERELDQGTSGPATSEPFLHQFIVLLRFSVRAPFELRSDPEAASIVNGRRIQSKRQVFEVESRVWITSAFAESVPMWGRAVRAYQAIPRSHAGRRRTSDISAAEMTDAVLNYLDERGVTAQAAAMIGVASRDPRGGMKQVLGASRLRIACGAHGYPG